MTGPRLLFSRARPGRILVGGLAVVVALGVPGACSSGGGSKSSAPSTSSTTATSRPRAADQLHAALAVTGQQTVSVDGTKGTCTLPAGGPATYVMTSNDYPALGPGGNIQVFGPTTIVGGATVPGNVTAMIGGTGFVSPTTGAGVTISPNQRQVTLNVDLSGGTGDSTVTDVNGAANPFTIHIAGTVRCS